ncbi:organelle RRM domain-containing protein 2, mitochondrial-like isoform X2 [Magnolia sinica]|uniref:organelle RRM domain-containing protein 2, mitochondrial-like isoform X2 n=1 Tax=Magnolia sinica TaxID=86752 RepID=UPI0026595EDA|nr:organelle RRM domain-containing protein 2, mitochondrial-like isoform X2 [Magnolia sinica]
MALRSGLLRRFLSTSPFASQPTAAAVVQSPAPDPSTSLFVSGLNKRTTSEKLREAFSKFGEVVQARVVTDRASGYSKGFGFVRYSTIEEADQGIKGMDGQFLDGWVIFAEYARPRSPLGQATPSENTSQPTIDQSDYRSAISS